MRKSYQMSTWTNLLHNVIKIVKKKIKQKHDKIKIIVSFSVHLVYDIIWYKLGLKGLKCQHRDTIY